MSDFNGIDIWNKEDSGGEENVSQKLCAEPAREPGCADITEPEIKEFMQSAEGFDFDKVTQGFIYEDDRHKEVSIPEERAEIKEKLRQETFEKYEKMMKSSTVLRDVIFSIGSDQGLSIYENGVHLFLPNRETLQMDAKASYTFKSRSFLRYPLNVAVKDVDRSNNIVWLSRTLAKEYVRPQIIEDLVKSINGGRYRKVKALVAYVDPHGRKAYLNILGLGIRGVIEAREFSSNYMRLGQALRLGDRLEVVVIGKHENFTKRAGTTGRYEFICSRRAVVDKFISEKWKDVEKHFPVGANVTFTCVKTYPGGEICIGAIDGFPDLRAYCYCSERPSSYTGEEIVMREGRKYIGYVKKSDSVKHILRIKAYDYFAKEDAFLSQKALERHETEKNLYESTARSEAAHRYSGHVKIEKVLEIAEAELNEDGEKQKTVEE